MARKRKRTVYLNKKWKRMIKAGFAADKLTNLRNKDRAVIHREFVILEARVTALEKRIATNLKHGKQSKKT